MFSQKGNSRGDFYTDRQLGISTCGIEEWADPFSLYHRYEPTAYRALDLLFSKYEPPRKGYLIDYGAGLGRINFYFYHHFKIGGYGLEIDPDRLARANDNLHNFAMKRQLRRAPDIHFLNEAAEEHIPDPKSNIFFFFNPFVPSVFEPTLDRIVDSLIDEDRPADLILHYPDLEYIKIIENSQAFDQGYLIDIPWSFDTRYCFVVFHHDP